MTTNTRQARSTETTSHGFICKSCEGPAPVGIGFVASGKDAAAASANIDRCGCGYSVRIA